MIAWPVIYIHLAGPRIVHQDINSQIRDCKINIDLGICFSGKVGRNLSSTSWDSDCCTPQCIYDMIVNANDTETIIFLLVDIRRRRKSWRITADILCICRLIHTNIIHSHVYGKGQVVEINVTKVQTHAKIHLQWHLSRKYGAIWRENKPRCTRGNGKWKA